MIDDIITLLNVM